MNKIEHDFKSKYLKYKHKYLDLKNQLGGVIPVLKCHPNYTYTRETHRCCLNRTKYCEQGVPIIYIDEEELKGSLDLHKYEPLDFSKLCLDKNDCHSMAIIMYYDKPPKYEPPPVIEAPVIEVKSAIYYTHFIIKNKKFNRLPASESVKPSKFIVKYYNDKDKDKIIIVYGTEISTQIDIINKMKTCKNMVVNHIIYNDVTDKIHCIIMENPNKTIRILIDIIKKLNNAVKQFQYFVEIIYAIIIPIKCLYDENLYYVKIEEENIFFRYIDNPIHITIILGNLSYVEYEDVPYKTTQHNTRLRTIILGFRKLILHLFFPSLELSNVDLFESYIKSNKSYSSNVKTKIQNLVYPAKEYTTLEEIISNLNTLKLG